MFLASIDPSRLDKMCVAAACLTRYNIGIMLKPLAME
jgi:hypothetical protein